MGETERRGPPPLPEKKKPKLIDSMVGAADEDVVELTDADVVTDDQDDAVELTDADIIPIEKGEELFEIDVDTSELSPDQIANAERRERERKERQPLLEALAARGLQDEAALEVIAAYHPDILKDESFTSEMTEIAGAYGVRYERMAAADKEKLAVMYLGAKNGRIDKNKQEIAEVLESGIKEQLVGQAFADIAAVKANIEREKGDPEKLKASLRESMATLNALSKRLPFSDAQNEDVWMDIYEEFNDLRLTKKKEGKAGTEAAKAFSEIFEEFSGFIDDEVIEYRLKHSPGASLEDVMRDTYGRSKEEMETIKRKNRESVVDAMKKMDEKFGVTAEMLEELHELNNKGIVPKRYSKLRSDADKIVTFGKRIGLRGPDVKPQIDEMLERANELIDRNAVSKVSGIAYEIEAAQLHNDLLDMHPFGDRNGSTSLLFLELMMMKKGYQPSPDREKDYYKHLAKVLDYNPIAMGVVGYEQYKISKTPGYYEGPGMTEEKKAEYDEIMVLIDKMRKRRSEK